MKTLRVACVQVSAGDQWRKNFSKALRYAVMAIKNKPHLIVFPENFLWRGSSRHLGKIAQEIPEVALPVFQSLAKKHRVAILLGSLVIPHPKKNKFLNASILISEKGAIEALYHKAHLFDIKLKGLSVRESKHFEKGSKIIWGKIFGVKIGLSICYDLRFPELFRQLALQGCQVLCVPANFTRQTGRAHWEVLLRARAIENQCFIVAPGQCGVSPSSGIRSFGTSLVIDPWGVVLGRMSESKEGVLIRDLSLLGQKRLRSTFPVLKDVRSF